MENRKETLLQLKKEILDLEKQIKYARLINFKNVTIKNLKISARFGQRIAPYVLVAGVMAGGCKLLTGGWPFIPNDEITRHSHIMHEFDSRGNIRYEEQYESFRNESSVISLYSKWTLQEDGLYTRTIKIFKPKAITEEDILKLFNSPEVKSLEKLFGQPIRSKKEYKNKLDIPEEENIDFLQATTYDVNKNDYIITKESITENFATTLLYIMFTAFAELLPAFYRENYSTFDYDDCVDAIKREYQKVDKRKLTKKIEIRRDNYNRLLK